MAVSGSGSPATALLNPGKPEAAPGAFDGKIGILQDGNGVCGERLGDVFPPHDHVVVAEDGIAVPAFELVEEIGALPRRADGESLGQGSWVT